jgi:glyceraldehyde 3-phosphate dehydrogenase
MSNSSPVRIALNGFGRIGRNVVRALPRYPQIELVAINDVMEPAQMAYLAEYDTVMGRDASVELDDGRLRTDAVDAALLQVRDPTTLPWAELDVDVVLECTGIFRTHEDAAMHLEAGARKVLISAPAHLLLQE